MATSIDVTCRKVHAPEVTCPRNILVQIKRVTAETNDDLWMNALRVKDFINTVLKVEDMGQFLDWNTVWFQWLWYLVTSSIKVIKLGC
jgi:hypothetical protein